MKCLTLFATFRNKWLSKSHHHFMIATHIIYRKDKCKKNRNHYQPHKNVSTFGRWTFRCSMCSNFSLLVSFSWVARFFFFGVIVIWWIALFQIILDQFESEFIMLVDENHGRLFWQIPSQWKTTGKMSIILRVMLWFCSQWRNDDKNRRWSQLVIDLDW